MKLHCVDVEQDTPGGTKGAGLFVLSGALLSVQQ